MKVLIRNVDNVVIYAQPDLNLTDEGLFGDGWRDPKFSTLNARIEDADLPDNWHGGVFSYSGGEWSVFDQNQLDKIEQSKMPKLEDYDAALTAHLDSVAQSKRYADRISCSVRAGYPGPFQAEGIAFATWMDTCNQIGYSILADFQSGNIPQPTVQEVIDALPPMVWPT